MSGMAQATGIQALGRAAHAARRAEVRRDRAAGARRLRDRARPAACAPPAPRGGVHYLQYSFAPRLYIFNAFLQSLIGLHDFGKLADDERARAALPRGRAGGPRGGAAQRRGRLVALQLRRPRVEQRLPRAAARVPPEHVHPPAGPDLLRLRQPLPRLPGRPARAHLEGPDAATEDEPAAIRFNVSKLSAIEVKVTNPHGRSRSAAWPPSGAATARSPGPRAGRRLHA